MTDLKEKPLTGETVKRVLDDVIVYNHDYWQIDKLEIGEHQRDISIFFLKGLSSGVMEKLVDTFDMYPDISNAGKYGVRLSFSWYEKENKEGEQ